MAALEAGIPESWNCIDCGVNTAPGCLTASQLDQALAAIVIAPEATKMTINDWSEVYAVKPAIWKRAGMEDFGGCLCIGCLEKRLGRTLMPKDFDRKHSFHAYPGTERLLSRRDG